VFINLKIAAIPLIMFTGSLGCFADTNGEIIGTVKHPSGAGVPSAVVTACSGLTPFERK